MKKTTFILSLLFVMTIITQGCKKIESGDPYISGETSVQAGSTETYEFFANNANISGCQYEWTIGGQAFVVSTSGNTADIEFLGPAGSVTINVNVYNCNESDFNGFYQKNVTVN